MSNNSTAAAKSSTLPGSDWDCLDRLPPPVRRALQESTIDWCSIHSLVEIDRHISQGWTSTKSAAAEVASIKRAEKTELAAFAKRYQRKFGIFPHVAARASILRYDSCRRARVRRP